MTRRTYGQVSGRNYDRLRNLVRKGKAMWYRPFRNVEDAIKAAGL